MWLRGIFCVEGLTSGFFEIYLYGRSIYSDWATLGEFIEKDCTFLVGFGKAFVTSCFAYELGIVDLLIFYTLIFFTFYCSLYCMIGDSLRYFLCITSLY